MKIVDTQIPPKPYNFSEIEDSVGTIFYVDERVNVFMTLGGSVVFEEEEERYNAISLVNGELTNFSHYDFVYPITAELVLK